MLIFFFKFLFLEKWDFLLFYLRVTAITKGLYKRGGSVLVELQDDLAQVFDE